MTGLRHMTGYIFIIAGLGLDVFGCMGLLRFSNVYERLQAVSKCITLGACCILFGCFIIKGFTAGGMRSLLCILFLLFILPTLAHALSRGARISESKPEDKK